MTAFALSTTPVPPVTLDACMVWEQDYRDDGYEAGAIQRRTTAIVDWNYQPLHGIKLGRELLQRRRACGGNSGLGHTLSLGPVGTV